VLLCFSMVGLDWMLETPFAPRRIDGEERLKEEAGTNRCLHDGFRGFLRIFSHSFARLLPREGLRFTRTQSRKRLRPV
jgi:hypothetical protein